jgi:phosphate transport system permease protein
MSVAAPPAPEQTPDLWFVQKSVRGKRRIADTVATAWMVGTMLFALVPLTVIVGYVIAKGMRVMSWKFLTTDLPIISQLKGGIQPAIVGTLLITAVATVLAVPLGILAAVYLNEYGKEKPVARVIRFMSDVMTGVPSIVMGLLVATVWVSGGLHRGYETFAGALALALLMLPIIIRSCEEMLKLVPNDLRAASDALGARRWRTVTSVVLPAALGGIVSGCMLAIARAAGETAPLLLTIGITTKTQTHIFGHTNTTLSQEIWFNAQRPFVNSQNLAWGAALTLIAIVFVFTVLARVISSRFRIDNR